MNLLLMNTIRLIYLDLFRLCNLQNSLLLLLIITVTLRTKYVKFFNNNNNKTGIHLINKYILNIILYIHKIVNQLFGIWIS